MKLTKKNYIIIAVSALVVGAFALGGYLWNSQVKELKNNRDINAQRIQELEEKLESTDGNNNSSDELTKVKDFVTSFYKDRIDIIHTTQGTSGNEQADKINELENGKITSKLKSRLSEPTENDRFFCVSDSVFSLISVAPTKFESSYNVKVTLGLGLNSNEDEHKVNVDVIKSGDTYKFDSTECSK
jgi:uncharacterized protein YneF (UPF0154 family)